MLPARLAGSAMSQTIEQLVERIHASQGRVMIVSSGGGGRAIAALMEVPGASRTLLEAVVPYSEAAMVAWLGGRPDKFCAPRTARAMAMAAFLKACSYGGRRLHPGGDSLYRQPGFRPAQAWAPPYPCGPADRPGDRHVVAATGKRPPQPGRGRTPGEPAGVEHRGGGLPRRRAARLGTARRRTNRESRTEAAPPWQDLLLGKVEMVAQGEKLTGAIFPGAFNPLHVGHRRMAEIAEAVLEMPVAREISILNVDKPPLDYFEIERRLAQFEPDETVWLTRAATFEEKSRMFPGATFIVGVDTLRRIAAPRYYHEDAEACQAAVARIAARGCRFLVFARDVGTGLVRLADLDLPETLRAICREIPPEHFREDVSSTEIRRSGAW